MIDATEGIRRTLAAYCHTCDDGRFDEFAELFTSDARFVVLGDTREGRDAIQAFMAASMPPEVRGKHMCANSLIEVADDGRSASAVTDFVFVGRAAGTVEGAAMGAFAITSAGRYLDELALDGERWRFARREIVFLGAEPAG